LWPCDKMSRPQIAEMWEAEMERIAAIAKQKWLRSAEAKAYEMRIDQMLWEAEMERGDETWEAEMWEEEMWEAEMWEAKMGSRDVGSRDGKQRWEAERWEAENEKRFERAMAREERRKQERELEIEREWERGRCPSSNMSHDEQIQTQLGSCSQRAQNIQAPPRQAPPRLPPRQTRRSLTSDHTPEENLRVRDVVKRLKDMGTNFNEAMDQRTYSILHEFASLWCDSSMVGHKSKGSVLHFAYYGYQVVNLTTALIENDADPNCRNAYGHTPLHRCCQTSAINVIKRHYGSVLKPFAEVLLGHGADCNALDGSG
jgi:hypothetical protein